ncbi:MAG TPA: class II aldolase/adducin family protein, partial [Vicinamibacterales bacterium]|nr:class II aldolase/adducin family protein [Vicinamibacterales bacterium]
MSTKDTPLTYVKYLWNDADARALDGLDRLVYRSNKLGEDLTLTNTGGGNTSSKLMETDPLNGDKVEVLWVKGSGGDLRTAKRDGFASLYLDKVRAMKPLYTGAGTRGPKTPIEDAMYPMYSHCVFSLNPRACSIDTPLHTFVPYQHVDHLHPNAVIAIAASVNQERLCTEIYGDELIYVPWQRPGFDIGLMIEDLIATNPGAKGVLLGHHGMSSWSNDDKTCYETALEIIDRATAFIEQHDKGAKTFGGQKYAPLADDRRRGILTELLPALRGRISTGRRFVGTVQDDERMLRFVNSVDAQRLAA